jgi:hypothetical protein
VTANGVEAYWLEAGLWDATGRTPPDGPVRRAVAGPSTITAIVSNGFVPAANSLLVAVTCGDSANNTANSATISDSLSGSWTQIILRNDTFGAANGYVQAWYQIQGASPASRSVTFTDGAAAGFAHVGWVYQYTGFDTADPIGASGGASAASGSDPRTVSLTTEVDHSRVMGAASNWNNVDWFDGNTTTNVLDMFQNSGTAGCAMMADATTTVAGTSVTLSLSRVGTADEHHLAAWEIKGKENLVAGSLPPWRRPRLGALLGL